MPHSHDRKRDASAPIKKRNRTTLITFVIGFTIIAVFAAWSLEPPYPYVNVADLTYPHYKMQFVRVTGYILLDPVEVNRTYFPHLVYGTATSFPEINVKSEPTIRLMYLFLSYTPNTPPLTVVFVYDTYVIHLYEELGIGTCVGNCPSLVGEFVSITGYVYYTPETVCWQAPGFETFSFCPNTPIAYFFTSSLDHAV